MGSHLEWMFWQCPDVWSGFFFQVHTCMFFSRVAVYMYVPANENQSLPRFQKCHQFSQDAKMVLFHIYLKLYPIPSCICMHNPFSAQTLYCHPFSLAIVFVIKQKVVFQREFIIFNTLSVSTLSCFHFQLDLHTV